MGSGASVVRFHKDSDSNTVEKTDFEVRGVTIELFQSMRKVALERNSDENFWSMGRISASIIGNHEILKEGNRWGNVDKEETLTFKGDCSLINLLQSSNMIISHDKLNLTYHEAVGERATVFVSFAYSDNFIELVSALESFLVNRKSDSNKQDTTCYFWFDMFVNDQWHALDRDFDWWANTFRTAVTLIGETVAFLSPWDKPSMLTRVWCLFEISCSKNLSIAISSRQREAFEDTLINDINSIMISLSQIDLEKADAYLKTDKEKIFAVVRQIEGGFHHFNSSVVKLIRDWIADTAIMICKKCHSDVESKLPGFNYLWKTGRLLQKQGKLEESRKFYEKALSECEALVGPDDMKTMSILRNYCVLQRDIGDFEGARISCERCLRGEEKILGPDHVKTLGSMSNLAMILCSLDEIDLAESWYEKSLSGLKKHEEHDKDALLSVMHSYGCLLCQKSEFKKAKDLFEKVLKGKEELQGIGNSDNVDTLNTVLMLAKVLTSLDIVDKAKVLYDRALMGQEKILGPYHYHTLLTLELYGKLLYKKKEFESAFVIYEKAFISYEKVEGPFHKTTLSYLENMFMALYELGNLDEAQKILEKIIFANEKAYGPDDIKTISCVHTLGDFYVERAELETAKALYERCLKARLKTFGKNNITVLRTKDKLNTLDQLIQLNKVIDNYPDRIINPILHEHELIKIPKFPTTSEYECNICVSEGIGWVYNCTTCSFCAHPNCVFELNDNITK